ncbi:cupin domain-containing protein [Steroidobacter agaridevorans]|uniref:cupin domain-containing protein n=1 Tax=Steroidobacter agaridevorans TaxID=2695856 RepID=UPI0013222677|nr:cupin domain-containing protein [Steroidobacter agaridevorans]GFE87731.1 cupin [Steroidobacter agaridevorans]
MTSATASQHFVVGAQTDRVAVDAGVERQMLGYCPELMLCRVWFQLGAVGSLHAHPHSQVTYVESGRFQFQVGNDVVEVGAGDCVYIPSDTQHGAKCVEAGVLIDCFSPLRADFLSASS